MSRAKKSEILSRNPLLEKRHDADVKRLAFLGNLIKKDTPLNEFSKKLGYPPSTISRFLSGNNRSASSDELIVSLAVNRQVDCGVSFRNLVNAQGYYMINDEKWDFDELLQNYYNLFVTISYDYSILASKINYSDSFIINQAQAIIQGYLINKGYSVKKEIAKYPEDQNIVIWTMHGSYRADFIFETNALEKYDLTKWSFDICCNASVSSIETKLLHIFSSAYLEHPIDDGFRISLVVNNQKIYQRMRMMMEGWGDHGIHDSISLILVDFNEGKVVSEYVLPRLVPDDNAEEQCVYDETIIGDEINREAREFLPKCDLDDFAVRKLTDGDLYARFNIPMDDEDDNQAEYIEPEGCQNKGEF